MATMGADIDLPHSVRFVLMLALLVASAGTARARRAANQTRSSSRRRPRRFRLASTLRYSVPTRRPKGLRRA